MKTFILLLLCLNMSLAQGEALRDEMVDSEEDIDLKSVTVLDQDMKGPERSLVPKVRKEKVAAPAPQKKLPSTEERDQLFVESGLSAEVSSFDSLDRDMF